MTCADDCRELFELWLSLRGRFWSAAGGGSMEEETLRGTGASSVSMGSDHDGLAVLARGSIHGEGSGGKKRKKKGEKKTRVIRSFWVASMGDKPHAGRLCSGLRARQRRKPV
jgi:hypothetical protein